MTNDEWSVLTAGTESLASLVTSGEGKTEFVINAGLRISLAALNRQFPASDTGIGLSIFADTLVFDDPTFNAKGVSIIARCADVSLFESTPMVLRPETVACAVIVGETIGGSLKFNTQAKPNNIVTVPIGIDDIQPFLMQVAAGGEAVGSLENKTGSLPNWLGRPTALNSLKASYTAAALLIEKGDPGTIATARSILKWVVSCCATLAAVGGTNASFTELGTQASALLITINVRDGVHYAPPLSADYYKTKISGLISALAVYEGDMHTLDVQTDIKKAISILLEGAPEADRDLLDAAGKLLDQQNELTASVMLSYQLWEAARGKPAVKLDVKAGVVSVDPRIAWQNYIDAAEGKLTSQFASTGQAQQASAYATALKALTQFGMGVDANLVALTAQLAEGVAVTARLDAE